MSEAVLKSIPPGPSMSTKVFYDLQTMSEQTSMPRRIRWCYDESYANYT